jgi:hypothetical protein
VKNENGTPALDYRPFFLAWVNGNELPPGYRVCDYHLVTAVVITTGLPRLRLPPLNLPLDFFTAQYAQLSRAAAVGQS